MSVQEQINRLKNAKSDIGSALEAKGVSVPSGTKIDGMAALIGGIETGIDTSDASAAATDIANGKTAYVDGEKVTGSVEEVAGQFTGSVGGRAAVGNYLYIEGDLFNKDRLFRKNSYMQFSDSLSNYGDATASDVVSGKTFTSTAGLKKTGTVEEVTATHYCSPNDASKIVNELCFYSPVESDVLLRSGSTIETDVPISDFGDAAVANVLSGKKFTSSAGYKREGAMANNGAVSETLTASKKSYTVPAGYHNGSGVVKINTQTKSATPKTTAQTITPDTGYLLSSVTVGAASSGKSVYTGTIFLSKSVVSQIQIDTGVTLESGDTFILVIADGQNGLLAQIVSAIKIGNSVNCVYVASAYGDEESGYLLDINESGGVTYSGTKAILNKGSYYYSAYSEYRWYVIKA